MANNLSRLQFLQRTAMAGVDLLLSSLEGFALAQSQKKITLQSTFKWPMV